MTAKKGTIKRDARAEWLFCQSEPVAFLPFSLPLPSSLLKLPNIVMSRPGRSDYPDRQLCRGLTKERIVKGSSYGAGVWRRMGIKARAWGDSAPSRARYVLASISTPPPFPFPQTPGKHAINRVTGSVWQTLRGGRIPTNHLITRLRKHPFFLASHR